MLHDLAADGQAQPRAARPVMVVTGDLPQIALAKGQKSGLREARLSQLHIGTSLQYLQRQTWWNTEAVAW